mgnify:FL=1
MNDQAGGSADQLAVERTGRQIADTILAGFVEYMARFRKVSRRAGTHFTNREWGAREHDADQRLLMHRSTVLATVDLSLIHI